MCLLQILFCQKIGTFRLNLVSEAVSETVSETEEGEGDAISTCIYWLVDDAVCALQ